MAALFYFIGAFFAFSAISFFAGPKTLVNLGISEDVSTIACDKEHNFLWRTIEFFLKLVRTSKIASKKSPSFDPSDYDDLEDEENPEFDIDKEHTIVKVEDGKAVVYTYTYDSSVVFVLNNYLLTNLFLALMLAMLVYCLTVRIKRHRREALMRQLHYHTKPGIDRGSKANRYK